MIPTQLTIRHATPDDAQGITTLHAAGWREGYGPFFDPEALEHAIKERRTRWSDLLSKSDLGGTLLLVGEKNGAIIAFAHAGRANEHPEDLEIYSFYAHPNQWGTGIARELMQHVLVLARADGYAHVYLSAYSGSARARHFYEKLGFRETGRTTETRFPPDVVMIDIEYVDTTPYDSAAEGTRNAPPPDRVQ